MPWMRSIFLAPKHSPPTCAKITRHKLVRSADRRFLRQRASSKSADRSRASPRASLRQRVIMILIRIACAAVALALAAAVAPFGRSEAATNQVIEMPNGLKYTDSRTGDGAAAAAGQKVSVHYT